VILRAKGMVFGEGRLTRDAEMKRVGEKKSKKVNLGIAVHKKGETPDYVNGVCWGERADYAEGLKKGDSVFFFGEEQPEREYNGKTYKDTEIRYVSKQPTAFIERGDAAEPSGKQSANMGDEIPDQKMPWDE
jgi:single-stranded DNA-binding protein